MVKVKKPVKSNPPLRGGPREQSFFNNRSRRSQTMDKKKAAPSPKSIAAWRRQPNRTDLINIDSKKHVSTNASTKHDLFSQIRLKGGTLLSLHPQVDLTKVSSIQREFERNPLKVQRTVGNLEIHQGSMGRMGRRATRYSTWLGAWTSTTGTSSIFKLREQKNPSDITQRQKGTVQHETGHAVFTDLEKRAHETTTNFNNIWNKKTELIRDKLKAKGVPIYGTDNKYKKSINDVLVNLSYARNREMDKKRVENKVQSLSDFMKASLDEGPASRYAQKFRGQAYGGNQYYTENFAEVTLAMRADDNTINESAVTGEWGRKSKGYLEKHHPKTVAAWREIMKYYEEK